MRFHSACAVSLACLSLLALFAARSNADIAMTAQEVGGDVVFSFSGSIDVTGLGASQPTSSRAAVYPVNAYVEFGPITAVPESNSLYLNSIVTADSVTSIGAGGYTVATSTKGSYFSVNNNSIKLPLDYASGTEISGSMTFAGTSLSDLQVTQTDTPSVWMMTNGQKITLTILDPGDDDGGEKAELEKKIKRLKKEIRIAKAKGERSRVKMLTKKLRRLKAQLEKL